MPTDIMHVNLKNGFYELEVKRRTGNEHQNVTSYGNHDSIANIALDLIKYHHDCVVNLNSGNRGFQVGAGSDRVSYYHPDMNPWNLQVHFDMSERDKNLLEGIVTMHNQYQKAITNGPELPLARLQAS